MNIKKLLKLLLPNIFIKFLNYRNRQIRWYGNFKLWQEASLQCTNYNNKNLLIQIIKARKNVLEGKSVYERDGINFDTPKYELELYSFLQSIFIKQKMSNLGVLDFGGALGSTFYSLSHYFKMNSLDINMSWSIVEQEELISQANEILKDMPTNFYTSIKSACEKNNYDVCLCSGVLQYLPNPYDIIDQIVDSKIKYLIIDRTPFTKSLEDRLCIQEVKVPEIKSKYPAWFFSREKFFTYISKNFHILYRFNSWEKANIESEYKGLFLERK